MKSIEQVKDEFFRRGDTVSSWAKRHGYNYATVCRVMSGESKCRFGKAHEIAVKLGLKDGELAEL